MSETITDTVIESAVKNPDIAHIIEILPVLSPERIKEAASFIDYLADRERRHTIFVEETLAAEQRGEYYEFDTIEDAMEAIRNWKE
ncbi:hypothetical protein [Candidatus Magnetominusculus xianensis]|uniref:DUF2281 domain-containing protein n=1 Tax=Candidatus Magnetominusculus xianensis TaxID=1748249 RepID=A0ABR5SD81_9BACT|nr:hypothetical protein [Candidatus Magnetominusculus xianensis]KWT82661.1 hypothetical protein ASN18_2417 [Candidatus Magnetominusculus xianensis]MBF0405328.1 hypothetical protein [Nitrospirota bacterium]